MEGRGLGRREEQKRWERILGSEYYKGRIGRVLGGRGLEEWENGKGERRV